MTQWTLSAPFLQFSKFENREFYCKITKMKNSILCLLIGILLAPDVFSQNEIDKKYKKESIDEICTIINKYYVFPEIALKTSEHLQKLSKKGAFNDIDNLAEFSKALSKEVQSINHDKHMRIVQTPPRKSPENTAERKIENKIANYHSYRENIGGFSSLSLLEGNVGYIDYRGFVGMYEAKEVIDSYMFLLQNVDALIIDLRYNGGGSPETVQYLCSYFFDERVHLNSLYWREGDETREFWSMDNIGGKKMADVPLFVLTSDYTFSGAEEFSYNMKTQKRAAIIGETTGGGANPGGTFRINKDLRIFVPTGTAINPITKTNWEGVGVIPDIKTDSADTYEKGLILALEAAENYRNQTDEKINNLYSKLINQLSNIGLETEFENKSSTNEDILQSCKKGIEEGLLDENDINMMGYDYLMLNQQKAALALFNANVDLHSESANVYDSYADALSQSGKLELAKVYYEKAVSKAEENQDPQLSMFQNNLEQAKRKLSEK